MEFDLVPRTRMKSLAFIRLNGIPYLYGPSNLGKTTYAEDQFDFPLKVHNREDLEQYDGEIHDGIIFDQCDWSTFDFKTRFNLQSQKYPIYLKSGKCISTETKKIITSSTLEDFYTGLIGNEISLIKKYVNLHPMLVSEDIVLPSYYPR
jgi:hypothetical protein